MNILAIESSAKAASVALCRDEFLVAESYQNSGLTHSSTLMPMCEALLRNCGTALEDVDLIAVANGPGSFTGLRIGIATAEVLPEIVEALRGSGVKVLVDGGIRTGVDVFKALALGADAVLIARPFVTAVYGGDQEGVLAYIQKLAGELEDTMQMCGAATLADITPDMVRLPR